MNRPSDPHERFSSPGPLKHATTTHRQGHFVISSRKLPISKAGPIVAMSARLGIPMPEMLFGDNTVAITHEPSGWRVAFAAEPALDRVDKTGDQMLQVAYAGAWSRSREQTSAGISEVVRPYDWSYSTPYRGSETAAADGRRWTVGGPGIPLDLLKQRDPILFYDDVVLYESEMDDNGISLCSVKVRVMEKRMLLLSRLYMRLDNVLVRVRDTRVYVDFEAELVVREYTAKEDSIGNVKRHLTSTGLQYDDILVALRDSNQVASLLPTVEHALESVSLGPV